MAAAVAGVLGCGDGSLPCAPRAPDATDDDVRGFYACAQGAMREDCGPDGYLLGFGGRYGQIYWDEAPERLSPEGQAWIRQVASCLQEALADGVRVDSTCEEVWALGFDSHDDCYLETGFCALPLADQLWVWSVIDADDQQLPEVGEMARSVLAGCAEGR